MKELIVKSILTTSLFLLIILAFVYNFIFNPLYQSLEETLLENFINIAETSKTSFDYILARGIENSKSISSRTMIKEKIVDYNQGSINLEELKSYTRPRYLEGIQALENIVYSSRKVDNIIIASSGSKPDNISTIESVEKIKYEFFKERDKINLIVYSPILEGKDDFVIRYGGDEFIILLKNVSNDIAEKVIKRISINLESIELADIKISFSYGIGQLENTNNFNKLLEKLDKRMYEMKVN